MISIIEYMRNSVWYGRAGADGTDTHGHAPTVYSNGGVTDDTKAYHPHRERARADAYTRADVRPDGEGAYAAGPPGLSLIHSHKHKIEGSAMPAKLMVSVAQH